MAERKYIQGYFRPLHPEKYIGNPQNIVYRSSWELRFMKWCDESTNVIQYGSEEFFIPYRSPVDNKVRRYFPDFLIKIQEQSGEIKTYLIEIKPQRQTVHPKAPKRKTKNWLYEMKTYSVNQAKWAAAEEWCRSRNIEFKIITEKELGI
jgi:hypothetical protein